MPRTASRTPIPPCRDLLVNDGPGRSLGFFLMENLLTARANSMFPTNGAEPDEDVNVYLAHLLDRFLSGTHQPLVLFAGQPLLTPPPKATPRTRAEFYRANADHRLLHLGLFGWGDGLRRRNTLHGMSAAESHTRDLSAGQACYMAAASHLRPRSASDRALADIWRKLAAHFADYVHVLGALATRQLGLGAKLSATDLAGLMPPDSTANSRAVAALLTAPPPATALDSMLDLWLEQRDHPAPSTTARLQAMAERLGMGSAVTKTDDFVE